MRCFLALVVIASIQLSSQHAAAQSGSSLYGTSPTPATSARATAAPAPAYTSEAPPTATERAQARARTTGIGLSVAGGLLLLGGLGTMAGFTAYLVSRGMGWGELDNPDGTQGGNTLGAVIGLGFAVLGAVFLVVGIVMAVSATRRPRESAGNAPGPDLRFGPGGLTLAF